MKRWLVAAFALASCSKAKGPSQDEAVAAYEQRIPTLDAFDAWVLDEVSTRRDRPADLETSLELKIEKAVDDAGAIGAEVLVYKEGAPTTTLARVSLGGCSVSDVAGKNGNVRATPEQGMLLGTRTIGYGEYQTAYSVNGENHGDGAWHPGIHVRTKQTAPFPFETMLCFLTDGTPRPK